MILEYLREYLLLAVILPYLKRHGLTDLGVIGKQKYVCWLSHDIAACLFSGKVVYVEYIR